jgi:hypothetical protein
MALFDFLKPLHDSFRKELESNFVAKQGAKVLSDVSFSKADKKKLDDQAKEIESLNKQVATLIKEIKAIPVLTKTDKAKVLAFKPADYIKKTDAFEYWKNQNGNHPVKSATLFLDTVAPTTAPDNQLTIVV